MDLTRAEQRTDAPLISVDGITFLTINHQRYSKEQMQVSETQGAEPPKSWLQLHFAELYGPQSFAVQVANFLAEWFSPSPFLTVQTSGSTGAPKQMQVSKEKMCNSARMTVDFLGLKPLDQAFLCMPLQYIAGKMVIVRALVAQLDLIFSEPSGRPLQGLAQAQLAGPADVEHGDSTALRASPEFAAMIPMQVFNTLQSAQAVQSIADPQQQALALQQSAAEIALLKGVKQLIIGGGSIDASLAQELQSFPHAVWSTYGMTETLSHIALRRLNGAEATEWYTPFAHVNLSLSSEQTLVIEAPLVSDTTLVTNDIVEFNAQGQFKILGRKDNTINTGGVKVQIEQVEAALRASLTMPFMISYAPDAKFGQKVVLLLSTAGESDHSPAPATLGLDSAEQAQVAQAISQLPPFWRPKLQLMIDHLPQTGTGKPDRATAAKLAALMVDSPLDGAAVESGGYRLWRLA